MNDLSNNKYLVGRIKPLKDYNLTSYLRGEPIVPRDGDADKIFLTVCDLLALTGFKFQFTGFRYIALLTTHYLIKNEFDLNAALDDIANICGMSLGYVKANIDGILKSNKKFIHIASKILGEHLNISVPTAGDAVEILGAIYKIHYNYITADETLICDNDIAVNFHKLGVYNGKQ